MVGLPLRAGGCDAQNLADQFLDVHWPAVTAVAERLFDDRRLDGVAARRIVASTADSTTGVVARSVNLFRRTGWQRLSDPAGSTGQPVGRGGPSSPPYAPAGGSGTKHAGWLATRIAASMTLSVKHTSRGLEGRCGPATIGGRTQGMASSGTP
jgi:hypothetical protein